MSDTEANAKGALKAPQVSGCPKNWAEMAGDDKKRYCEHCTLHVHDLSAMPRREAEQMMREAAQPENHLCLTYLADSEGNLVTLDELRAGGHDPECIPMGPVVTTAGSPARGTQPAQPEVRSRWSFSWLMAGFAAGTASLLGLSGCASAQPPPPPPGTESTGFATPPPKAEPRVVGRAPVEYRTAGIVLPPQQKQ